MANNVSIQSTGRLLRRKTFRLAIILAYSVMLAAPVAFSSRSFSSFAQAGIPLSTPAACQFSFASGLSELFAAGEPSAQAKNPQPAKVQTWPRAITDDDLRQLQDAMQVVDLAQGHGSALRLVAAPGKLNLDQVQALLSDVTSLLADINAEAVLAKINADPKLRGQVDPAAIAALQAVQACAAGSFDGRGGKSAYQASRRAVQAHLADLAEIVGRLSAQRQARPTLVDQGGKQP